jgi:hypothetical protein
MQVLIMINLYTASSATRMTMTRLTSEIQGIEDLGGRRVQTWDSYAAMVQRHGVTPEPRAW